MNGDSGRRPSDTDPERRRVLRLLGKGSVAAAFFAQIGAAGRALFPNVLYEPPARFKLKRPSAYPQGYTFDSAKRLFIVREDGKVHTISAICTHLGCTVQWKTTEFDCPCHGSRFRLNGTVIGGPAPRPLPWWETSLSPDGFLEIDTSIKVARGTELVLGKTGTG